MPANGLALAGCSVDRQFTFGKLLLPLTRASPFKGGGRGTLASEQREVCKVINSKPVCRWGRCGSGRASAGGKRLSRGAPSGWVGLCLGGCGSVGWGSVRVGGAPSGWVGLCMGGWSRAGCCCAQVDFSASAQNLWSTSQHANNDPYCCFPEAALSHHWVELSSSVSPFGVTTHRDVETEVLGEP